LDLVDDHEPGEVLECETWIIEPCKIARIFEIEVGDRTPPFGTGTRELERQRRLAALPRADQRDDGV